MRFRRVVVLAAIAALAVPAVAATSPAGAATKTTAVVFVHGIGCGAINYTGYAAKYLVAAGEPLSNLHTVAYYACDTAGDPIMNEGDPDYLPSPDGNGTDTDIARISYELAWYLWNDFGSKNLPVDLVGHSMGGVIIAYALQRVAAHDPSYPASLTVPSVVSFSSPLGGVPAAYCTVDQSDECAQLITGSSLINSIDAVGAVSLGGTQWTAVGSDGADEISSASALALPNETYKVDYTFPAYTHTGYLTDASTALNARGTVNGVAFSGGPHGLAAMTLILR